MPSIAVDVPAVVLAATATDLMTPVPTGKRYDVATVRFCNLDLSADHQVTFYDWTPASESIGDTVTSFKKVTIQKQSTFEIGPFVLPAGRKLTALADLPAAVSARMHAWQVDKVAADIAAILLGAGSNIIVPTIGAGLRLEIPCIRFTNLEDPEASPDPDALAHKLTIFNFSPSGESEGDTTTEYKEITIQAGSAFEYGPLILPPGRRITAVPDAASKISARPHAWEVSE